MSKHTCSVCELLDGDAALKECSFCDFCLLPDVPIYTTNGWIPIKDVKIGEQVLTHTGRFRTVSNVLSREYSGEVKLIKPYGSHIPIGCTPNHQVLVAELHSEGLRLPKNLGLGSNQTAYVTSLTWKETINLKQNDCLVIPKIQVNRDVKQINIESKWVWGLKPKQLNVNCDREFMRFIGFYLSEGHVSRRSVVYKQKERHELKHKRFSYTTLSFGKNLREFFYAMEITNYFASIGLKPLLTLTEFGWRVSVYSVSLAEWIYNNFKTGSLNKTIPNWILELPEDKLQHMLDAYIQGDGCKTNIKYYHDHHRTSTVSLNLALTLKLVGIKLGYSTSIRSGMGGNIIQGRKVNVHQNYTMSFNPPQRMMKIGSKAWNDYYLQYNRLRPIETKYYNGLVCDLHVDEDHSFVTPAGTVHNCGVWICGKDLYNARRILAWAKSKGLNLDNLKKALHIG